MKRLQEHLNRWLVAYVALAMAAGLALGHPNAVWIRSHQSTVNSCSGAHATQPPLGLPWPDAIDRRIQPCTSVCPDPAHQGFAQPGCARP